LDIIANQPNGIYQHEIKVRSGLTRQTVHSHLKKLTIESAIYQHDRKYFITGYLGGLTHFGKAMAEAGAVLAGVPKCDITYDSDGIMNRYLTRTLANFYQKILETNGTCNRLCETHFSDKEINEKQLFEFANKIGAFIMYIFIEVMRPPENTTTVISRNVRGRDFLEGAISIRPIFNAFQEMLINSGIVNKKFSDVQRRKESLYELDSHDFTNISNIFETVYPVIYQALENYWLDEIHLEMEFSKRDCEHEWDHKPIYKLGNYYLCRKCHQLVSHLSQ
jgi:hypothetical protein